MHLAELKAAVGAGLLSFPVTDFDQSGNFNAGTYAERLEWLAPYNATALFVAGGTGEFFSLTQQEYPNVIKTAVDRLKGRVPVIAGTGYGTRTAIQYAQEAERLGADGLLLLPHYLSEASQEGLFQHVKAVCESVKIGVIVYNRGPCKLQPATLVRLADACPNLVGFKDGFGDIDLMVAIRQKLGDRFVYLGGLPTAEVFARPYLAMGVTTYSSAVFNFIPKTAMDFYRAIREDDHATVDHLLNTFFLPFIELRNKTPGYAVSLIKAGVEIVGHGGGKVRPPLSSCNEQEYETLRELINRLGAQ
ncbi:5-dehydro-4-deoxyglucarate dehydratase [Noviherbaspirillum sp. CPCC 100848]|uniref:Probable 5-dehydro-4-deoxyglucarate dehydratase n=1 Tax=Noviherbaspirillum album TaxID=3080276 RepID=A0ABU6JJE7_9BURK|nr:5-dehydro-4-deoxyglucarate dehydratase [Noviherbaspirillum sp. CPCC 100848]MEC4723815.1 5-dehydro-4-deoxyglucarate dehydratase [Noviherbaspirillum sp. CPCC 100848]